MHLLHHIVDGIREKGPVRGFWMFPVERFMRFVSQRCKNASDPEITVVKTYQVCLFSICRPKIHVNYIIFCMPLFTER